MNQTIFEMPSKQLFPPLFSLQFRANFPGGALTYTEFFSHVTKQISGLPGWTNSAEVDGNYMDIAAQRMKSELIWRQNQKFNPYFYLLANSKYDFLSFDQWLHFIDKSEQSRTQEKTEEMKRDEKRWDWKEREE